MNNIDTKTPFISNIKMNKEFNSKLNSTIISKNDIRACTDIFGNTVQFFT